MLRRATAKRTPISDIVCTAKSPKKPKNRQDLINRIKETYLDLLPVDYMVKTCKAAWPRLWHIIDAGGESPSMARTPTRPPTSAKPPRLISSVKLSPFYSPMTNLTKILNVLGLQGQKYEICKSCFK